VALSIIGIDRVRFGYYQGKLRQEAVLAESPVPVSILQLWFPRVELHLAYNTIVFIPMAIGMYYHMFPPAGERQRAKCTCAWHRHDEVASAAAA